jgi:tripartite-type tricarboxylate transporter receptor subunit TctC
MKTFAVMLAACTALTMSAADGWSQGASDTASWPNRPIRAIIPLSAGSATDVLARTVLEQVSTQLGQPIVIENRPGAGNLIGMAAAAKADPDGYTLLVNSSTHTVIPATRSKLAFDAERDLVPILPLANIPVVFVVLPSKGYKTLADYVEAGKKRAGGVNYSSAGAGNASHLNGERFRLAAKLDAVHIPTKGAPEAITEVLADRADFYFAPLLVAMPMLKGGQLQALAVAGTNRAGALPDVPTTVQAGYPNSDYNFWVGLFAPGGTPQPILDRLHAETAKALANPAVTARFAALGADPMPMSAQQFGELVRSEIKINSEIVKAANIKVD